MKIKHVKGVKKGLSDNPVRHFSISTLML